MDTYIKKVVTLTNEEKDILREAAKIMGHLYAEIDNRDFDYAETVLVHTYSEGTFSMEINE